MIKKYNLKKSNFIKNLTIEDIDSYKYYKKYFNKKPFTENEVIKNVVIYQKNKNNELLSYIVTRCQGIVYNCAKTYAIKNHLMDYISEGNIGLLNAIKTYDISKKSAFESYAIICIMRQYQRVFNQYFIVNYKILSNSYFEIKKIKNNESLNIEEAIKKSKYKLSKGQQNAFVENNISDKIVEDIYFQNEFENNDFNSNILKFIKLSCITDIDKRNFEIIKEYFGIDKYNNTQESIAEKYNVTKSAISQIIKKELLKYKDLIIKYKDKL